MTRKQRITKILEQEYEDHCRHDKVMLVFPSALQVECEGASISVVCVQCKQTLESETYYE